MKIFFKLSVILSTILSLFILYDLTSYDSSYINQNSIKISKNNLNSKKIKKIFSVIENYYSDINFKFSKSYRNQWSIEDSKKRDKLPDVISIKGKKNNFKDGKTIKEVENYLKNWRRSHGNILSVRFSNLDQINISNVKKLEPAWIFRSKDGEKGIQANPIIYAGNIYMPTPGNFIVCLDGKNGNIIWKYKVKKGFHAAKRGMQIWEDKKNNLVKLFFTNDDQIIALNAITGKLIKNFGKNGSVKTGSSPVPPIILNEQLILVTFKPSIEIYDIYSGDVKWKYYLRDSNSKSKDFKGGNPWGGLSADDKRGVIYLATGNPHPNYVGVNRPGKNLFANSILAIDIENKKKLWHFQETCHDLWNNDLPAAPILTTINKFGKRIDVVVVVSKLGNTIVLDRDTGKSLFDYELHKAPTSKLQGEKTCEYQPVFKLPEPFAKNIFKKDDVTDLTLKDQKYINAIVQKSNYGFFETYELGKKTIQYGDNGGAIWAGASIDPYKDIMFVSSNNVPWEINVKKLHKEKKKPRYIAKAKPLRDLNDYPGSKPPWGTLTALNISTGKKIWQVPLGYYKKLKEKGKITGTENFGGATATAGNIVFVSGTLDKKIRAFNSFNGDELWSYELPFIGSAPPTLYEIAGEQYVVIPASGGIVLKMFYGDIVEQGDAIVSFKLKK